MQSGPDVAGQARFYQALTSGRWSNQAERDLAARYESMAPGTGDLIRRARLFHARQSARAAWDGIRCQIHTPAGYPGDPEPHLTGRGRLIPGVHILADPGVAATLVNQVRRPRGRNVHAVQAGPRDAEELLSLPAVPRNEPVAAHIRLMLRFLPPDACAGVIAAWGELLPPGSRLVLSVPLVPPGPGAAILEPVTGPAYSHSRADVEAWTAAAGFAVPRARVIPCGPECGWELYTAVTARP